MNQQSELGDIIAAATERQKARDRSVALQKRIEEMRLFEEERAALITLLNAFVMEGFSQLGQIVRDPELGTVLEIRDSGLTLYIKGRMESQGLIALFQVWCEEHHREFTMVNRGDLKESDEFILTIATVLSAALDAIPF